MAVGSLLGRRGDASPLLACSELAFPSRKGGDMKLKGATVLFLLVLASATTGRAADSPLAQGALYRSADILLALTINEKVKKELKLTTNQETEARTVMGTVRAKHLPNLLKAGSIT